MQILLQWHRKLLSPKNVSVGRYKLNQGQARTNKDAFYGTKNDLKDGDDSVADAGEDSCKFRQVKNRDLCDGRVPPMHENIALEYHSCQ